MTAPGTTPPPTTATTTAAATAAGGGWTPRLGPAGAARALEAARLIAERATSPPRVRAAVELAARQSAFPGSVHWDPVSLAQGDTGQALLCAQLHRCFPDEGWERTGHAHLASAVAALERRGGAGPSLFGGLSGVSFCATVLGEGRGYRRLRQVLDAPIAAACLSGAAALRRPGGVPVSAFDLISGLSGIAAPLLAAGPHRPAHPALAPVLRALVALARPGGPDGSAPPWHTPVALLHDEEQARAYPFGNLNCGLAHGIPGPLALLALAARARGAGDAAGEDGRGGGDAAGEDGRGGGNGGVGDGVEGLEAAVRELARWLLAHRADDAAGPNWPAAVPLVDGGPHLREGRAGFATRSAWCYGSPGVARALWLAGSALGDEELCHLAVRAMEAVYRRPVAERRIDSPTFCHGVAGLLQVTLRFAHDTGLPVFTRAAADLTEQILTHVDPARPMGIAAVEPAGNLVDQPGFLDGAGGVALVLLAAATDREPVWDRAVALS
ncbi:lanthionine synthetase C family protein [Kitasatospora sp. NPDC092039]|uniref:lanthionine synthetase C family protein n=1 Tax=Kitasatospora sp. NPDC092039 TaxID=3364086 RepID=UPI0037F21B90